MKGIPWPTRSSSTESTYSSPTGSTSSLFSRYSLSTASTYSLSTEPTEIIVLCDGTGKNGRVDKDPTNIYWLYSLIGAPLSQKDGNQQKRERKVLYIPGVGAESKGIPKYLALVFGKTIVEMVIKAYMFIIEHYKPGDEVCIFGYSRGAFVARKVAGLLHRVGSIKNENDLLTQWQSRERPVPWSEVKDTDKSIPVRCLGVWDTVGAIYSSPDCEIKDLLGIPDAELPPNVNLALHVVAFHENRKRFRVTLFEPNGKSTLKEVWFPGAHADVGGGGEKLTHLPRLSLIWMIGELRSFMEISDEKLKYPLLTILEPSDAYSESPAWKRAVDKSETRLESKALQSTSKVHQTLRDMKQAATRHHLLTINDLLSLKWNIQTNLVPCNTLEIMKQARTLRKSIRQEHERRDRNRAASLPVQPGPRLHRLSIPASVKTIDVLTESPAEASPISHNLERPSPTQQQGTSLKIADELTESPTEAYPIGYDQEQPVPAQQQGAPVKTAAMTKSTAEAYPIRRGLGRPMPPAARRRGVTWMA